jgi:hypothetical protein
MWSRGSSFTGVGDPQLAGAATVSPLNARLSPVESLLLNAGPDR